MRIASSSRWEKPSKTRSRPAREYLNVIHFTKIFLQSRSKLLTQGRIPMMFGLCARRRTLALLVFTTVMVCLFDQLLSFSIEQLKSQLVDRNNRPTAEDSDTRSTFRLFPSGRYLTNCDRYFAGQLGNHLFKLAAMLYIANITGRQVFLTRYVDRGRHVNSFDTWLKWFNVEQSVAIVNSTSISSLAQSSVNVSFSGQDLSFDRRVLALKNRSAVPDGDLANVTTVQLCAGFFQSWRYVEPISETLRRLLQPKPGVFDSVTAYFESVTPKNWTRYKRIGIHVRAGDVRTSWIYFVGFTVPTRVYFERALRQIILNNHQDSDNTRRGGNTSEQSLQQQRLQLFVAGDDITWARQHINFSAIMADIAADHTFWSSDGTSRQQVEFDLVYSEGHDPGFDLLALSMCDEVVMSTGTYGWWAGWLSAKNTTYFKQWPRPGSPMMNLLFTRQDFFPPSWIGIDAPFLEF